MMGAKKSVKKMDKIKIPLGFKHTVLAALETPPEPKKKAKRKAAKPMSMM